MALQTMLSEGQKLTSELIAFRRALHRHPELSNQEQETSRMVSAELQRLQIPHRVQIGGHGIVAELKGSLPGPVIALRADMDALPIQEETELPFASAIAGVMHACGHDAHTAILLGAAKLLTIAGMPQRGTVRLLFQSAEEINAGARAMIEQGALEGVDEIYGLHNLPTLPAGMAATRSGPLMGSVDRIEIKLVGKGGHGAMPDKSIDPIVCASAIVMSLQSILSRELPPFEPAVVTIGSIQAGDANNVIPQYAVMTGTVRTFSPRTQRTMQNRIERIVLRIAEGYRCEAELRYIEQVPVLVNHDVCVRHVEDTIDAMIGAAQRTEAEPTMAGEDYALYLEHVPGCFFWLGSGPAEDAEHAYGLHHPKFNLNEACIPLGASLLAAIAWNRLITE